MFLVKSNFATPTPFGSLLFVVGICLSNYNLNSFLIHQASYSKGYQWYLMQREVWESIWKIGRDPIKVSEVLLYWKSSHQVGSESFTMLIQYHLIWLPWWPSWKQVFNSIIGSRMMLTFCVWQLRHYGGSDYRFMQAKQFLCFNNQI